MLAAAAAAGAGAGPADGPFVLVPEMEEPAGIVAQPRGERRSFGDSPEARRGLERLAARVEALWPRLREVDWAELSRFHVDETRGWRPPAEPGELAGRAVGRDDAGHWYLELRGPRLPARYDIVHRHLHVYARYDPATGELDRLTVTLRGWVLE